MPEDTEPPQRQFTDSELREAVSEHAPASTSEVAEALGVSRRAVDYRLKRLADDGEIERKKIAKVQVWYSECH
jgi:predicted ArsR family transcriptional regulator